MTYDVVIDGEIRRLELSRDGETWQCRLDGREVKLDAVLARRDVISMVIDGTAYEVKREATPTDLHLWVGSARYAAEVRDPRSFRNRRSSAGGAAGIKKLLAPMPGKVVRVLVSDPVRAAAMSRNHRDEIMKDWDHAHYYELAEGSGERADFGGFFPAYRDTSRR